MRKELGQMIREKRLEKRLKEEQLARKLKISTHYVRHLENECKAAIFTDSLMTRVVQVLDLPIRKVMSLAETHNRRVRRYRTSLKAA